MYDSALAVQTACRPPSAPSPTDGALGPSGSRRLEDWIVSHVEDREPPREFRVLNMSDPGALFGVGVKNSPRKNDKKAPDRGPRCWNRIRVERRGPAVLATALDSLLVKEEVVRELASDLESLVDHGVSRLILDFRRVERLGSQIVGLLIALGARCASAPGGRFRLCELKPGLADVFDLCGARKHLDISVDLASALDGPWPDADSPRALPIELIQALRETGGSGADILPIPTRLVVTTGSRRGASVVLDDRDLTIGRGEDCRLRCTSPKVSRLHAIVQLRDGLAWLRDQASTNGTLLNGQRLGSEPRLLTPGDRVAIGPLELVVERGSESRTPSDADPDSIVMGWLGETGQGSLTLEEIETAPVSCGADQATLKVDRMGDTVVFTPGHHDLNESMAIRLREAFHQLADEGDTARVIVDCDHVRQISARAVGVLVAELLRLEKRGGSLRLAQVHDRVRFVLDQIRLPMLLTVYPRLEEAVLDPWE